MEGLFPVFVEKEPVSVPLLEGVLEQMFDCLLSTSPGLFLQTRLVSGGRCDTT